MGKMVTFVRERFPGRHPTWSCSLFLTLLCAETNKHIQNFNWLDAVSEFCLCHHLEALYSMKLKKVRLLRDSAIYWGMWFHACDTNSIAMKTCDLISTV